MSNTNQTNIKINKNSSKFLVKTPKKLHVALYFDTLR